MKQGCWVVTIASHLPEPPPSCSSQVKTKQMISGYYGDEEATKRAFDEEGYFCTGDIGEKLPSGKLRVIGRVKNATKLANGEFVQVSRRCAAQPLAHLPRSVHHA